MCILIGRKYYCIQPNKKVGLLPTANNVVNAQFKEKANTGYELWKILAAAETRLLDSNTGLQKASAQV